jgi:hypothetical protein
VRQNAKKGAEYDMTADLVDFLKSAAGQCALVFAAGFLGAAIPVYLGGARQKKARLDEAANQLVLLTGELLAQAAIYEQAMEDAAKVRAACQNLPQADTEWQKVKHDLARSLGKKDFAALSSHYQAIARLRDAAENAGEKKVQDLIARVVEAFSGYDEALKTAEKLSGNAMPDDAAKKS